MVFDAPNKGSPSLHLAPLSRGRENRSPKIFFATTGVPFASIIRNSSRVITQSCIPSCYLSLVDWKHRSIRTNFSKEAWAEFRTVLIA